MSIHIGSIIKKYCLDRFISVGELCKLLAVNPVSVYHIYRASDLRGFHLLQISNALKHDFFQYYQADMENDPQKIIASLNQQIQELTKSFGELKNENVILKTENDLMKKIVKAV
jgi:hypothetical protein